AARGAGRADRGPPPARRGAGARGRVVPLRLAAGRVERELRPLHARLADGPVLRLVAPDVLLERRQQPLRVRRRDDDAALDARLRHPRHHADEVEDELLGGVRDHHEVRVDALGDLLGQLYRELGRRGRLLFRFHAGAPVKGRRKVRRARYACPFRARAAPASAAMRSLRVTMWYALSAPLTGTAPASPSR